MSRKCQLSGKGPMSGNNRSHALNATRRKWNVNLQKATVIIDGKPTKVRVSARQLRTLRKNALNRYNNRAGNSLFYFTMSNTSISLSISYVTA